MKIIKTTFSNFLSFGKKKQEFNLLNGLNLVCGIVPNKSRSNSAGKSNLLASITVSLYGRDIKGIKQDQLINWKNRKKCELEVFFTKKDNNYIIRRGFKPNYLEIYENEKLIPHLPSIKDDQQQINEIIGMNFDTFVSLVFFNINHSVPFMRMGLPQKRSILEKIFDLEVFTRMSSELNKKINNINVNITEYKNNIDVLEFANNGINESNTELIKKIAGLQKEIIITEDDLNYLKLSKELIDVESKKLDLLKKQEISKQNIVRNIKQSILYISNKIRSINEEKIKTEKDRERIKNLKNKLPRENIDYSVKITELNKKKDELQIEIDNTDKKLMESNSELAILRNNLKTKNNYLNFIKNNNQCPTCNQIITNKEKIIESTEEEIGNIKNSMHKYEDIIYDLNNKLNFLKNEKSTVADDINLFKEKINLIIDIEKQLEYIGEPKEINSFDVKRYESALIKLKNIKLEDFSDDINELEHKINSIIDKSKKIEKKIMAKEYQDKMKCELEDMIKKNKKDKAKNEIKIKDIEKKIKKLKIAKDHFEFMKEMCKDDKVKQYAISSQIPYISERTNEYLSYVGHDFYIELDKFMEMSIKGPGFYNCSYKSLCGGESKSVDIALLMAFHDIARKRSSIKTDILVLDELLDTSVDAKSLDKIVDIIRKKQLNDNLKVFIISHRDEIDIEFDNVFTVIKEDGYSKLKY